MNGQDSQQQQLTPETTANPEQHIRQLMQRLAANGDPKPLVKVPAHMVTITESAEALFKAIAPKKQLFYRGGVVVELIQEGEGYEVKVLDPVGAQSRFEKYVRFVKQPTLNAPTEPTNISESIAKQYLKSEACRDLLPAFNGLVHCPFLVEKDGQLHRVEQGYDEVTGLCVAGAKPPLRVGLADAVGMLSGLLNDFDFVSPGDRSRAIASFLTPALKFGGLISGPVPIDVAEANASQSGKTYRQKMVAALYNQDMAVVTKRAGGVGSMEESFAEHLIRGSMFIQFDNVRGKLDSQYLESFTTATNTKKFAARIPYHGSVMIDPSKFILFISSNGFEATKDLTNRASIIRIRKRENYSYRALDGKDVLALIYEWQPLLMGCVFAVIEEWHKRGKPKTNETRHSFRDWCQILDWIVQNIFQAAPLMDGHEEAKERAASPQLTFLRGIAIKLNEQGRLNRPITASDIADLAIEENMEIPGLSAENQTIEQGRTAIGRLMAKQFERGKVEMRVEEFTITRQEQTTRTLAGNDQRLFRYTFVLAGIGNQTGATNRT